MQHPGTVRSIWAAAIGAAALLVTAGEAFTLASRQAVASADIAKKTGQPCAKCHTAPPALNGYGKKYKEGLKK